MMQSELFDCPICYVKYHREGKVPKIISTCGHTLCSICLTSILQTQSPQCPLDRKPFDQNLRSADKFPTNILILQLLEEATPLPSCSGDKHKEIADMVCLTDKCTVCKHCVESEAHKGHNILHAAAMKNYTAKKKQELKDQLKSMERDFKPVYDLLKIQKESSKANIKETCNKLINLISLRERELLKEVDDIFFQEKVKVDEMYEEASITSEEILKIIALLDSQTFSQEFLEALGYIPLQNLDDKKSFESIEVMITEMKAKLDSELKDLGALILSKITNFKPLPSKEKVTKFTTRNAANLFFYKNMLPSKPSEINLSEIHEKWYSLPLTCFLINKRFGNYDPIQRYQNRIIQWLFPNFYSSQVNVHSVRLQDYEAEIFKSSIQVASNLRRSYELILDFIGIEILNPETGELKRTENWEKRYKSQLIENEGNYSMIRRVLACLNITGFRRYAIQLVNFLEKEIYGQANGFELYMKNSKEFDQKAFQTAPLKKFVEKPQIFQILSHYGDHHDSPQRIKLLEENCLAKYPDDFQLSIYFNGR